MFESNKVQTITSANSCSFLLVYSNNSHRRIVLTVSARKILGDVVIYDEKLQEFHFHLGKCMIYNDSYSNEHARI